MRRVVLIGGVLLVIGLTVITFTRPDRPTSDFLASSRPVRPAAVSTREAVPTKIAPSSARGNPVSTAAELRSRVFAATPAEAIDMLSALTQSPDTDKLILEYLEHLASMEDRESIKLAVARIPDGPGLWGGMNHAARPWAGTDAKGLLAWTATVPSKRLREHVALGIANYLLNQPPEQVSALIDSFLEQTGDEILRRRLHGMAMAQMLKTDSPDKAAEWALQIPDTESPSTDEMFRTISDDAAKRFLQALYDRGSTERADEALLRYLEASAHRNPEHTANWVLEIQDVHTRNRALRQTVMSWGLRDKPSARRWVESNAQKLDANALLRMVDSLPTKP